MSLISRNDSLDKFATQLIEQGRTVLFSHLAQLETVRSRDLPIMEANTPDQTVHSYQYLLTRVEVYAGWVNHAKTSFEMILRALLLLTVEKVSALECGIFDYNYHVNVAAQDLGEAFQDHNKYLDLKQVQEIEEKYVSAIADLPGHSFDQESKKEIDVLFVSVTAAAEQLAASIHTVKGKLSGTKEEYEEASAAIPELKAALEHFYDLCADFRDLYVTAHIAREVD